MHLTLGFLKVGYLTNENYRKNGGNYQDNRRSNVKPISDNQCVNIVASEVSSPCDVAEKSTDQEQSPPPAEEPGHF